MKVKIDCMFKKIVKRDVSILCDRLDIFLYHNDTNPYIDNRKMCASCQRYIQDFLDKER
jgi:hypothetical protein